MTPGLYKKTVVFIRVFSVNNQICSDFNAVNKNPNNLYITYIRDISSSDTMWYTYNIIYIALPLEKNLSSEYENRGPTR